MGRADYGNVPTRNDRENACSLLKRPGDAPFDELINAAGLSKHRMCNDVFADTYSTAVSATRVSVWGHISPGHLCLPIVSRVIRTYFLTVSFFSF